VENLQREDLNPVDEPAPTTSWRGVRPDHDEIASQVGKDRSTVSNLLRLLRLPSEVLDAVSNGALSVGHARALLSLRGRRISRSGRTDSVEDWSVRETEVESPWCLRHGRSTRQRDRRSTETPPPSG